MKNRIKTLVFGIIAVCSMANAQITVDVSTEFERYIAFEPVRVTVTLKNISGQTLYFGEDATDGGHLIFEIKNLKGIPVSTSGKEFDPIANLVLSPGVVKTLVVPISDYFVLQEEDDYHLTARVGHPRLSSDYLSTPKLFQVRDGIEVWAHDVGFPGIEGDGPISTRRCTLNMFHHGDGDFYYLQIEDHDYVYAVARLGPRVQGIRPQCDIDALSRVHTLIQAAPRLFRYRVFDLNGDLKMDSVYIVENTMPRLINDPDVGRILVYGGKIAVDGVDYNGPAPVPESKTPESSVKRKKK